MAFSGSGGGRFTIRQIVPAEQGDPGAGFYIFNADREKSASTDAYLTVSFTAAAGRPPVEGDIFGVRFLDQSCSFVYDATDTEWDEQEAFIDGNLVVAGSVFSNVSVSVGVANIQDPLKWNDAENTNPAFSPDISTTTVPTIDENWSGAGAFLGFAGNPASAVDQTSNSGFSIQQEILLVGTQEDHIFFDGERLTLSGVTIQDPQIFITPPTVADVTANIDDWVNNIQYNPGDVVAHNSNIWRALATNTDSAPTSTNTNWQDITASVVNNVTEVPAVTIGETAPAMSNHGDLWYDETLGKMFIFVAHEPDMDQTSGTWGDVTHN